MPVDHYENFPVASWLLPAPLREPVEAIYGFARGADDVADEGDAAAPERLAGLARYERALDAIAAGADPGAEFARIAAAVARYGLPLSLLRHLLDAFRQDVTTKRYGTFAEVMDYARRSANPVGRLLLHLFDRVGAEGAAAPPGGWARSPFLEQSDAICSALQLVNFWQDVAPDWRKDRVYIPGEDLARFGVAEAQIAEGRADERWARLMAFECDRARAMLAAGAPLGSALPGRIGLEIRATVEGGLAILDRIDAVRGDVFRHRPTLRKRDWMRMLLRAATKSGVTPPTP